MATNLGDVAVDSTIDVLFSMNAATGAAVAPSGDFEAADFRIYKDGSDVERGSTAGWTTDSSFDGLVGVGILTVDLSDNTTAGFYAAGHRYYVVLAPDTETVDGQVIRVVLAYFTILNTTALKPTVAGRTLDVASTGEAGLDFTNVKGGTVLAAAGAGIIGNATKDSTTYRMSAWLIVNGAIVPGASLSNEAVVWYDKEGDTDLNWSATPAVASTGCISGGGTLDDPGDNKPVSVKVTVDFDGVTYSGILPMSRPA